MEAGEWSAYENKVLEMYTRKSPPWGADIGVDVCDSILTLKSLIGQALKKQQSCSGGLVFNVVIPPRPLRKKKERVPVRAFVWTRRVAVRSGQSGSPRSSASRYSDRVQHQ